MVHLSPSALKKLKVQLGVDKLEERVAKLERQAKAKPKPTKTD